MAPPCAIGRFSLVDDEAEGVVGLAEVLHEAIERARKILAARTEALPPEEAESTARLIGLGAVKYAELSQNRLTDYVFSWDKLLAFEGNTAPYLLYAVVRVRSIFRKTGLAVGQGEEGAADPETPTEIALARKIVKFPDAIRLAGDSVDSAYRDPLLLALAPATNAPVARRLLLTH